MTMKMDKNTSDEVKKQLEKATAAGRFVSGDTAGAVDRCTVFRRSAPTVPLSAPRARTPEEIIGKDRLLQLIFEGYEVVPASTKEQEGDRASIS